MAGTYLCGGCLCHSRCPGGNSSGIHSGGQEDRHQGQQCQGGIQPADQAKTFANASDEDKAAVAMALYLYEEEKKNLESRVLTITHTSQAWTSQLNPRL